MSAGLLESAQNLIAGVLDLGRTRFELFSVELREELARLAVTLIGGVAAFFFVLAGITAWQVRRVGAEKPRAFDATLTELQRDLTAIKP